MTKKSKRGKLRLKELLLFISGLFAIFFSIGFLIGRILSMDHAKEQTHVFFFLRSAQICTADSGKSFQVIFYHRSRPVATYDCQSDSIDLNPYQNLTASEVLKMSYPKRKISRADIERLSDYMTVLGGGAGLQAAINNARAIRNLRDWRRYLITFLGTLMTGYLGYSVGLESYDFDNPESQKYFNSREFWKKATFLLAKTWGELYFENLKRDPIRRYGIKYFRVREITTQSLEDLKKEGISEDILKRLEKIKYKGIIGDKELCDFLGVKPSLKPQKTLLKQLRIIRKMMTISNKELLAIFEEEAKRPPFKFRKDGFFIRQDGFRDYLSSIIGNEHSEKYWQLILSHAKPVENRVVQYAKAPPQTPESAYKRFLDLFERRNSNISGQLATLHELTKMLNNSYFFPFFKDEDELVVLPNYSTNRNGWQISLNENMKVIESQESNPLDDLISTF